MAQLPIQKLVLYKQGIGYYERRGSSNEPAISVVVPRIATNDVLKSLNVTVFEGSPVQSIDYETPEDKTGALAALPIKLTLRSNMVDLLSSLRGSEVALHLSDGNSVSGRIIGIEASLNATTQIVLLQDQHEVRIVQIDRVASLTMQDERAAKDVGFFLDMSRTEESRTTLTVRLGEGVHDLGISYLAPSPTWRVSYRLIQVAEKRARLVGWGLFENSLEEDLENVSLTLISGRPVSFEYALSEARIPPRPEISDDPTALDRMPSSPLLAQSMSTIAHDLRSPLAMIMTSTELLEMTNGERLDKRGQDNLQRIRNGAQNVNKMLSSMLDLVHLKDQGGELLTKAVLPGPLGDLKVSGSYFIPLQMANAEASYLTYPVANPVSVRRGQSALVPIIDSQVDYEELCVYNGSKLPNHPLRVWRLRNLSGVALEQGPITVISNGQYAGEGLMRFVGVGDEIQIPFALEFGILVGEEIETKPRVLTAVEFRVRPREVQLNYTQITERIFTLTSRVDRTIAVNIEQRDPRDASYDNMPEPVSGTDGHSRWLVMVPANESVRFVVRERESSREKSDVTSWTANQLEQMRALLLEPNYRRLQLLLEQKQQGEESSDQAKAQQSEYDQLITRQDQLRKNLGSLGTSSREETIRNRILDDLEASENRRRALEISIASQLQKAKDLQVAQQTTIDDLFSRQNE